MKVKKRKITSEKEESRLKNKVIESAELPRDVVMGMPVLTMIGQSELSLENYRGILEYTDTLVRILTRAGQIKVSGHGIHVAYYTNDEMKITGHIESIEYQHS